MKISELLQKHGSDKSGDHFYGELYDLLFTYRQYSTNSLLELGVWKGQSLLAWQEFFPKATIYGIDSNPFKYPFEFDSDRIKLLTFPQEAIHLVPVDFMLDIVIDDCSHVAWHQMYSFCYLQRFLSPVGIYIIEDVQSIEIANAIKTIEPRFRIIDLRSVKNRHDDIIMVYEK